MSKILKVFVNIVLILFILIAAALFVPPLLGVSTVVSESGMETNIRTGSVVYGVSKSVSSLEAGDKIIETGENSAYIYEIESVDVSNETAMVTSAEGDTPSEITLRTSVQRVVITAPLIGYISIAMQTMEGRIILGMSVALLVVLFIVAEVWSRRDDDEEDEDEEDEDADQFYAKLAQQKKESDAAEERKFRQKENKQTAVEKSAGDDWKVPQREEAEMFIEKMEPEPAETAVTEPAADSNMEDIGDVQAALEAALVNQQMSSQSQTGGAVREADTAQPLKPDEIELAIPARSLDDLLQEAYANGEDPKVEKDELTGVTFVDLSDCL